MPFSRALQARTIQLKPQTVSSAIKSLNPIRVLWLDVVKQSLKAPLDATRASPCLWCATRRVVDVELGNLIAIIIPRPLFSREDFRKWQTLVRFSGNPALRFHGTRETIDAEPPRIS